MSTEAEKSVDTSFVIFAIIALVGTQAILSDLHETAPRVIHSVPFKILAIYSALYMSTRDHVLTAKAVVIFVLIYWLLMEFESKCADVLPSSFDEDD